MGSLNSIEFNLAKQDVKTGEIRKEKGNNKSDFLLTKFCKNPKLSLRHVQHNVDSNDPFQIYIYITHEKENVKIKIVSNLAKICQHVVVHCLFWFF